jgi:acylphosphatase
MPKAFARRCVNGITGPPALAATIVSMDGKRVRVVVHGRVQGVFFRDTCRRQAAAAGVAGWVRNAADETVEAAFEGDPAAVDRMVEWCRTGPRHARVTGVDVHEQDLQGETRFEVRG